jgi:ankyrin repeat protein
VAAVLIKPVQGELAKTERLAYAAEVGNPAMLEKLLASGADVDSATNNGMTPLMRAASNGHLQVVRLLLDHGADLDAKRVDGLTALSLAAFFGHLGIVDLLLRRGVDAEAKSRFGTSAEMLAKGRGFLSIVELLEGARIKRQVLALRASSKSGIAHENKIPEELEQLPGDPEININANQSSLDTSQARDQGSIGPTNLSKLKGMETDEKGCRDVVDESRQGSLIEPAQRKAPQTSAMLQVPLLARSTSSSTRVGAITFAVVVICGLAIFSVVRIARQDSSVKKIITKPDDSSGATQSVTDFGNPNDPSRLISEPTEPGAVFDSKSNERQRALVEELVETPPDLEKFGRPQRPASERTMPLRIAGDRLAKIKQVRDGASSMYRATGPSVKNQAPTLDAPAKIEDSRSEIILSEGDVQKTEPEVDSGPAPLTIEPTRRRLAKVSAATNVDETRSDRSPDVPAPSSKPKKKVIQWP